MTITSSLYARYYFELRSICENEINLMTKKPMTKKQAIRRDPREKPSNSNKNKKKSYPKSLTLEDLSLKDSRVILS